MPEKVLPLPLSGEEVRTAILDKISQSLQRDCFLSPNLAYDFYQAHVKLHVTCHDVGREAQIKVDETVTVGDNPDALLEQADAEFDIVPEPPNTVRVESGQDVPVLTKGATGKAEIRGIRYARSKGKVAK